MDRLGWAASSTYHVGSYLLTVRTDTYDLDTMLRSALEAHVVDAPANHSNYSVRLADDGTDGAKPLKALYRGSGHVLASRCPERVIDALLAHLSHWVERDRGEVLQLDGVAAVGRGPAVVLPGRRVRHDPVFERRLTRAGLSLLDAPVVPFDPATGEVVVGEPRLTVDHAALASLRAQAARPRSEGPPVRPGRYPVACWIFGGAAPLAAANGAGPSPAEAVLEATRATRPTGRMTMQQVLDGLAAGMVGATRLRVRGDAATVADAVVATVGE